MDFRVDLRGYAVALVVSCAVSAGAQASSGPAMPPAPVVAAPAFSGAAPAAQSPSAQAANSKDGVAQAAGAKAPDSSKPAEPAKKKGKKEEYTGPTEVVELPPTPMLDEEGKQRLDPDAKPMFNPPVRQQRDKKGHPLFDEKGKPVFQTATELGYDEKGHKIKTKKEKPPKMRPVSIVRGTYTVDGVIGKAALNYDIADLKYIYLYAPGVGIAVVGIDPFPGAKEQARAFDGVTLTVSVDGHQLQLASDKPLLGKKAKPESAFVLVDREFAVPARFPVMGYGEIRRPPYAWPGAKPNAKFAGAFQPPPIPVDLRPVQLLAPCPAGQMRKPAPKVLPGQVAPPQPCIPIAKGVAGTQAKSGAATPAAGSTAAKSGAVSAEPAKTSTPAVVAQP